MSTSSAVFIGQKVAKARIAAQMTQLELAQKIGMQGEGADAVISRLEAGLQEPRLSKLTRIADALGVSLESLLPV